MLLFCMPTAYWQSVQKLYSGKHPADDFSSYGQCTRSDCKHRKRHFPAFQSWICSLLSNVRQRRALTVEMPLPKKGRSTERPFDRLCLPEHCHDIGGAVVVDEGRAHFAVTGRVIQQLCRRAVGLRRIQPGRHGRAIIPPLHRPGHHSTRTSIGTCSDHPYSPCCRPHPAPPCTPDPGR